MNILILGGTGAIGSHLCDILSKKGYYLYVTSRSDRPDNGNVYYKKGNALDLNFLNQLLGLKKWDAIIDFMAYQTSQFEERYKLFLDATKQYIFLSSARVYANTGNNITENSPRLLDTCKDEDYLSTDEYALAKARQENFLLNSGNKNWTIIRPYITYSEQRLQLSPAEKESWLFRALNGRSILFSRDLAEKITTFTYGDDVAYGISSIIGEEKAYGECFHITANESFKWGDILECYLDVIEKETGIRAKVKMLDTWVPLIGGSPMQVKWDRLFNRSFDNTKIGQFVDVSSFKKTMPTLSNCLSTFIKKPRYNYVSWTDEAKKDRITHEWARLSDIPSIKHRILYMLVRTGFMK